MFILSVSLLIQIFYVIPYIHNQEIKATGFHQEEIVQNIARELVVGLNRIEDRLSRMAILHEFRNMNVDAMQKIIMQHKKISEIISTIAVINSEGWFVCGSMEDFSLHTTKSYADRPYWTSGAT